MDFLKRNKWTFAVGAGMFMILASMFLWQKYVREPSFGGGDISVDLQLKVGKDNIIAYKEKSGTVLYYYKDKEKTVEENEVLSARTTNSQIFKKDDAHYTAKIYSGVTFYENDGKWYEVKMATTTKIEFDKIDKSEIPLLTRLLIDPVWAASPLSTTTMTGNGMCSRETPPESWATSRASATANICYDSNGQTSAQIGGRYYIPTTYHIIYRSFLPFYVLFPTGATITSSSIHIKISELITANPTITLVTTTQASPTAVAVADFQVTNPNLNNAYPLSDAVLIDVVGWEHFHLTTPANTYLQSLLTGGYAMFGGREAGDLVLSTVDEIRVAMFYLESQGASEAPFLLVDYDVPSVTVAPISSPLFIIEE